MHRHVRSVAAVGIALTTMVVGCSSEESLTGGQRQEAMRILDELAETAMIELSEDDRACAADRLSPAELEALRGETVDHLAAANVVVDCVGEQLIGASILQSQAGSVAETSLACAVDEIDRTFVIELVAGAMASEPPQVQAEIEIARSLGVCLELEELLDQ